MSETWHATPEGAISPTTQCSRVVALNRLSSTGYELILERNGMNFKPGQLINLHGRDHLEDRSYSVCSGMHDPHLTVLFRLIPTGVLTPQLVRLKPGDTITVSGPYGEFLIRDRKRPLMFFATGTGIAPCRCYLRSHSDLNMTLIHGVRLGEDLFYRDEFSRIAYQPCLTGEAGAWPGAFAGRVTDFARTLTLDPDAHYYLCGANEMIYEMQEWLEACKIDRAHIFTEAYYYRSDDS